MTENIHKDLVNLGDALKQSREAKGLSLQEVEAAIAIRLHCLEAIESGYLGKLISPVYARGFIKKYASYLGLDGDALMQEHPHVLHILNEFSNQDIDLLFDLGPLGMRNSPEKEIHLWKNLGRAAVVVAGIGILWWMVSLFFK